MDCYCGLSHWSVAQPTANDDCFIFWGPYFESVTGLKVRPYAIGGSITWFGIIGGCLTRQHSLSAVVIVSACFREILFHYSKF